MLDNIKSFILAAVPTSPAFYLALESPSAVKTVSVIVLPIVFFIVGKFVDVCVQVYFRRQEAKRRDRQAQIASTPNLETPKKPMKKFDSLILMMIAAFMSAIFVFAYATRTDHARPAVSQSPSVTPPTGVNTVSGNPVLALDKRPLFDVGYFTSNLNFERVVNPLPAFKFDDFQPPKIYSEQRSPGVKYRRILYDKRSSNFKVPLAYQTKPRSSPTRR